MVDPFSILLLCRRRKLVKISRPGGFTLGRSFFQLPFPEAAFSSAAAQCCSLHGAAGVGAAAALQQRPVPSLLTLPTVSFLSGWVSLVECAFVCLHCTAALLHCTAALLHCTEQAGLDELDVHHVARDVLRHEAPRLVQRRLAPPQRRART